MYTNTCSFAFDIDFSLRSFIEETPILLGSSEHSGSSSPPRSSPPPPPSIPPPSDPPKDGIFHHEDTRVRILEKIGFFVFFCS